MTLQRTVGVYLGFLAVVAFQLPVTEIYQRSMSRFCDFRSPIVEFSRAHADVSVFVHLAIPVTNSWKAQVCPTAPCNATSSAL